LDGGKDFLRLVPIVRAIQARWADFRVGRTLLRRIVLGVSPFIILFILVMGSLSYLEVRRRILANVWEGLGTLAQNASLSLQSFFQQRLNDLDFASETPLIRDYFKNLDFGLHEEAETHRRDLERYFARFSARAQVYSEISLVDKTGRQICSARPPDAPSTKPPAAFQDVLGNLRRDGVYKGPIQPPQEDGPPVQRYAKPIFDETGLRGAVVLDCDLSQVQDVLRRLPLGQKGRASLQGPEGRLLLGEHPDFPNALVRDAEIRGTPWRVVVVTREEEYLRPVEQIRNLIMVFSVLVCVLILIFVAWKVSAAVRPIREMVKGTEKFAAGELSFRIEEPETQELKVLAVSFNRMAESLGQREKELGQRIRQLTALREMEGAVIQRPDEEAILRTCLEAAAQGCTFDRTVLYWVDHQRRFIVGRHLYGAEAMGWSENAFQKRQVPLGADDILNEVIRTRRAALVKTPDGDPRLNMEFVKESKTREFILAPICSKDRVFGVIGADNFYGGRPLQESDRDALTLFANAMGLALENLKLFQDLAQSEARYRTVLENSPEAVLGISREFWITTWNRGAESVFGYSAEEMLGKPLTALFGRSSDKDFKALLADVIEKGSVRDHPMPGMTKAGRRLDLSLSWGGAHQDFWMNQEWAVVIRDVTEAKKIQRQLISSEKLSAVGQLISGIAHELNNPLTAVVGYADILNEESAEGGVKAEELRNDLRIINENAIRCRKIIDNLLLFVRQGEVEKRPVRLDEVVKASLDLLDYKMRKAGVTLAEVEVPEDLPRVKANFQQVQQVFVNLVNNACDAMSSWNGARRVSVRAELLDGRVRLEVRDTGPGVPADIQGRLFEPFFTTKSAGRGTGLGLSVCRQILEDHGGQLGLLSREGEGSTFWFDLPPTSERQAPDEVQEPAVPAVAGKSILILDDEPDVRSFLAKVFEREKDKPEEAAGIKDAVLKASQKPFDLVVADIQLGEETGIDFYNDWPRWCKHPRPAFLFLTGDVLNPTLMKGLEQRGLSVMHKPLDMDFFLRVARTLLSKSKASA
jgi:PAS domain S-box-containing protein